MQITSSHAHGRSAETSWATHWTNAGSQTRTKGENNTSSSRDTVVLSENALKGLLQAAAKAETTGGASDSAEKALDTLVQEAAKAGVQVVVKQGPSTASARETLTTGLARAAAASGNARVTAKAAISDSSTTLPASTNAAQGQATATAQQATKGNVLVVDAAKLQDAAYVQQLLSLISGMMGDTSGAGTTSTDATSTSSGQAIAQSFLQQMGVDTTSHTVRAMKTYQKVVNLITEQMVSGHNTFA